MGSSTIQDHWAIEIINAVLPLTEVLGPAERIKARNRSTPAKDLLVPDAVKVLPILPSIQSAYALGYKRMVIDASYVEADVMLPRMGDVLFITGNYAGSASSAFMRTLYQSNPETERAVLAKTVAALAASPVEVNGKTILIPDLYLPQDSNPSSLKKNREVFEYIDANRTLRWEDAARAALDAGEVTMDHLKQAMGRGVDFSQFSKPALSKTPARTGT